MISIKNRKAAIELSISTIVVIVIAMAMLILGLTLVRTIFNSATASVNALDTNTQKEISKVFASEEDQNVLVRLGADSTASIKPNTPDFSIAIAARTPDGSPAARDTLQYKLSIGDGNCNTLLGGDQAFKNFFATPFDKSNNFDAYDGSNVFANVVLSVPKGTPVCTQKVNVDVIVSKTNIPVGGSFFVIKVIQAGILG